MSEFPSLLAKRLRGRRILPVTHGKSGDRVYRLIAPGTPTLYLNLAPTGRDKALETEAARMKWFRGRIAVPAIVDSGADEGWTWLLMSEVSGTALHDDQFSGRAHDVARMLAQGLRQFHSLCVSECPFDERLDELLSAAHDRMEAGQVDEGDFDASRLGSSAAELWGEVLERRPATEDLVVVHGDYCLPNVVVRDDMVSGFVDLGRAGIADRYLDLALVTRSLVSNGHAEAVDTFFVAYGLAEVDEEKIEFYRLLDEFF